MSRHVRILSIPGRTEKARAARLARVKAWMGAHGWRLTDYLPEEESALFERAPGAPPVRFWHPTRWAPAPGLWRPGELVRYLLARPRWLVGLAVAGFVVFVAVMTVREPPAFVQPPTDLARPAEKELWLYVNADALNVRAEPTTGAPIVGVLYRNQRVLVEERAEGWAQVSQPERGYVAERFLQEVPAR